MEAGTVPPGPHPSQYPGYVPGCSQVNQIRNISCFLGDFYGGKIMVTSSDKGEYRAFCFWKMEWQTFAILLQSDAEMVTFSYENVLSANQI